MKEDMAGIELVERLGAYVWYLMVLQGLKLDFGVLRHNCDTVKLG